MPAVSSPVGQLLGFEIRDCVCACSHLNRGRLEGLVAEHSDHLYYIKDILSLGLVSLNSVLTDQLLNRLLIPLYVFSLTDHSPFPEGVSEPRVVCGCQLVSFSL